MKTILLKILFATLFLSPNLLLTAQSSKPKKTSKVTNTGLNDLAKSSTLTLSNASGTSNESLIAAADVQISAAPALSHFRLWYNNGDHKVNTIGILHEHGAMKAKYKDQNGDDPFRVEASWVNVPGATGGTIYAAGAGTFNIQLPAKPANTTILISGFSFERLTGTDHNIRTMSIKIDQETSIAQVSFIDDQREDYRTIVEPTMTGGVLGLVPFGAIAGSYMSMESIVRGIINEGKNTARPYAVTLQYTFIPNSRILASGSVSGTNRDKSYMQGQKPNYGAMGYRGFVLKFNNSDHHILGVGIHLLGLKRFPGQRGPEDAPITWQDNNLDDSVQWFVEYSSLK